jgi:heme/copper-type cytochrome/quinol oxidase subunit 3
VIPYTTEPRADTGVTNVQMGVWLFLASEVMLFGALFSAYALLRTSAPVWPSGRATLDLSLALVNTVLVTTVTGTAWRARRSRPVSTGWVAAGTAAALAFLVLKSLEYRWDFARGLHPATNTFLAMYFVLTGLHALHVLGGVAANAWLVAGTSRVPAAVSTGRAHGIALYWTFVDVVWLVILVLIYLT